MGEPMVNTSKYPFWSGQGAAILALIAASVAFNGCKSRESASATKSLDNFTSKNGAKLTFNSCSGSEAVKASSEQLRGSLSDVAAMKKALTAVPVALQNAFFNDLQGAINIVPDISSICGVKPAAQSSADDLLACWRGGESGIGIFIKAENDQKLTERNIRHSVVRMMGYVLTDVIMKSKRDGAEAAVADNPALTSVKKDIATALKTDTEKSKDYRIPDHLKSDEAKFADAAFAEAFDSFYCSAESQTKMAKSFPKTFAMFQEIASLLPQGLSGTLDPAETAAQGSKVSAGGATNEEFGLWGRWGWGNGPIRQGFRNWANYRSNGGGFMNFRRWSNGGGFFFRR
jgi:hypothetical protein